MRDRHDPPAPNARRNVMNAQFAPSIHVLSAPCPHSEGPGRDSLSMTLKGSVSSGSHLSALIVAIAERHDRDAFSSLFNYFAPRVKSYIVRLGAGAEIADEIAQETLLTVWRKAAAFDPNRAAASTWIFTIARNLRIDGLRKQNRTPPADDPSTFNPGAALPDDALAAAEDEFRIARAIEALPASQAEVIRMAFLSDKPHSEIAANLGLPLGTVKSRLRLALARLRQTLEETL